MIDDIETEHLERACSAYMALREHADENGRVRDATSILRFLRESCGLKSQHARETSAILIATGLVSAPHMFGGRPGIREVLISDMDRQAVSLDEIEHLVISALLQEVAVAYSGAGRRGYLSKADSLIRCLEQYESDSTFAVSAETLITLIRALDGQSRKIEEQWNELSDIKITAMLKGRKPEGIVIPTTPLLEAEISRIMKEMKKPI